MSTGSWSELSAEHEVRYTDKVRFLVITMSKKSGVAKGLHGFVVGVSGPNMTGAPVGIITQEFPSCAQPRVPIHVFCVDLPVVKTGIPLRKGRTGPLRSVGGKARGKLQEFFTGLSAIVTWMAAASKWVRPGIDTEWWTIPRRTGMAVPPPAVGLSVRWQTIGKPEGFTMVKECLT